MLPTAETELAPQMAPPSPPWQGLRAAALAMVGAAVFFGIVLLAYELAVARVPQHRAALERLVRAQTGLDIRFDELGLRWGWYGPEAVFRRVELGEPGRSTVLLTAPELVAGFDVWQTLRSGQLEADRITLVAADIDFRGATPRLPGRAGPWVLRAGDGRTRASARELGPAPQIGQGGLNPAVDAARILQGWRGGRVDLEGGVLRLPDPGGSAANPLVLQIRRASLRRTPSEWSGYGLVFLPERLGRTAQVVMRLDGDLQRPAALSGTVRFEGRRLAFSGWHDFFGPLPQAERYLPRAGAGDVALDLDFSNGRVVKASGKVSAGGLEFAAPDEPSRTLFGLDRLRGEWRLAQRDSGWRLQVDSLELGEASSHTTLASLSLDAGPAGAWIHGTLAQAPLQSVAAIARWFVPQLDLSGVELGGTVRNVVFDWSAMRPLGQRLHTAARLVDVAVAPSSHVFKLTGLAGNVSGDETDLMTELETRTARLELAQAPQYPLEDVHVDARLQIERSAHAWRVATGKLEMQHETARLSVEGMLAGDDSNDAPQVNAHAELTGVDVPLLDKLAGASMARTFGATFSSLMAGRVERAQLELRGPVDETLLDTGFTGALLLRDAALSGGDLWPETRDLNAHIEWHGRRIRTRLEGVRLQAVAGIPTIDDVRGTLMFDRGSLRRSTLSGTWLGGPVMLNVGQRREHGALVLAIQGHGVLDARQLALAATAGTVIDQTRAPVGNAEWSGELAFMAADDSRPAQWRVRADSSLIGIVSHLPEPLAKMAGAAVPLHIEAQGTAAMAQLRLGLGERFRGLLSLQRHDDATWRVERGDVQFGTAPAVLPAEPMMLVEGRVSRLDLPAYVAAWQQLRQEPAVPVIRAELTAGEMLVAGHSYSEVKVLAERADAGADLRLQSPEILGTAHWPAVTNASHPALFHFAKLNVPDGDAFAASAELIAALGPATEFAVDDIVWAGHSIGSATAKIESGGNVVDVTDLHLSDSTQDVTGTMHCQSTDCRLKFSLESSDAAATLEDFGFRPELTAAKATLDGDLEWQAGTDRAALETLVGRLNMSLQDGATRVDSEPNSRATPPFALLLVPALVNGMSAPGLRFSRLDADFELDHGEASTSDLHFDGDAEILMRGRTSLLARSYDQQAWILRGEGRLPAAVRRLGPTPRVAAAWLSLRDLFEPYDGQSRGQEQGSKASLHLQGSWDDPIVRVE